MHSTTRILDDDECMRAELDMAAYLSGALPEVRNASLFEHLMECDVCLQALIECMSEDQTSEARRAGGARVPAAPRRESMEPVEAAELDPETSRWPRLGRAAVTH